ncbi:MAG: cation diffusion facilitator family transporter [Bacteroidetes bacterium]|nr:cation diffusion facilitator family transporter [Bacteroidota bacterium]
MKSNSIKYSDKKIKVALTSLYTAVLITLVKIVAAYFSGSLGILSEVFNSGIDIFVCFVTIISIKYASKPPDKDHNYGHEKAENFSALFQVFILFMTSAYIIYEAVNRLFIKPDVELNVNIWIIGAMLITIVIDFFRAKKLREVAKETNSQALEADALHFSSDILSSSVVMIGLLLAYFRISKIADTFAALFVTLIIIYLGYKLLKKSMNSLMDKVPDGLYEKIKYETLLIKGVEGINSCRIRTSGSIIYIDMTIEISRLVPFSKAHDIMDNVEKRINEIAENSDIIIHSEPVETADETINDKIRLIVNDFGLKCHDIFSHKINNEIFSELHIEVDDTNDLTKAHNIISDVENEIKKKIDIISELKIHIDEPSEILFDTTDITESSNEMIREVRNVLNENKQVLSSNSIQVISTNGKIRISLNCVFDYINSFDEVHDIVTQLESRIYLSLKEKYPKLANVIIHAEPSNIK